jgi:hypothetical protein
VEHRPVGPAAGANQRVRLFRKSFRNTRSATASQGRILVQFPVMEPGRQHPPRRLDLGYARVSTAGQWLLG